MAAALASKIVRGVSPLTKVATHVTMPNTYIPLETNAAAMEPGIARKYRKRIAQRFIRPVRTIRSTGNAADDSKEKGGYLSVSRYS